MSTFAATDTRSASFDLGAIDQAVERACSRIAPTWPLDRFIAVNPFWGLVAEPLPEVAAKLRALSGASLLMPRAWYLAAYREGRLRDAHLQAAIEESGADESLAELRAVLSSPEPAVATRARVVDAVDAGRDLAREPSWKSFVTHSASQICAAFFDDGQADFAPDRTGGLYASWRRYAIADRAPMMLMGARDFRGKAQELPANAREMIAVGLRTLGVPPSQYEEYLWSLLLDLNGWASWCAYRRFTSRLAGGDDDAIRDLLAIRLGWEWILFGISGDAAARRWAQCIASWPSIDESAAAARPRDWLLQAAMEIAWREPIVRELPAGCEAARPASPSVQAVFCIDVRSEVYRRALEASLPTAQTLGFAGFFGLPIEFQGLAAETARPQLPGLLSPRLRVQESAGEKGEEARATELDLAARFRALKTDPLSTFGFVEALGITYAAKLIAESFRLGTGDRAPQATTLRLAGERDGAALDVEARTSLAHGMLRGMSLTHSFARVVLLAGHGSTTRNNPHAAGFDCGACCGQTGEINARVAASLLNDSEVRSGLAARGVRIPDTTWFVAALHDTTRDEVTLFDLGSLPATHRDDIEALRAALAKAGDRARSERAAQLGIAGGDAAQIARAVHERSVDWAQVRPEWGLANNAALIVAPREHCRHLDLRGRSFLHEYRHEEDEGYEILELIMTAPMIVTHWINFQYYASTVDNRRYGSGNKVLHNVVGGHLGVFEGNGGDLRIGLPLQCLHDGERWVHTPLRSSVFIEAPRPAIDAVIAKHETVRALVTNGWIALFQIDERERAVYALRGGRWHRCARAPEARLGVAEEQPLLH